MTITPDKTHPQYDEFLPVWKTCRDATTGQRAVHAGGDEYLPKLSGQSQADYKAYLTRALYFNATGRTVEGMVGLVFRKRPTIALPVALEPYLTDIDAAGQSLNGFAQQIVEEVVKVSRVGVLVEYPPAPEVEAPITIDTARQLGQRPYLTTYKAESILNWRVERVNNQSMIVSVFLSEKYGEDDDGEDLIQIRELFFDGLYGQRIWRSNSQGWAVISEYYPTMNGQRIRMIPFFIAAPKEGTIDVQNPIIESLAYVNLAHYRNSADLENGAHVAGLPTPWVNGITDPSEAPEIYLGATTCLKLPPDATAGFLQCGSEGFATLEKAMTRKEEQMAALGARMLAPEKKQAETAEAHEIKRGGENSVLATLAGSVESTITKALRFMAEWVGSNPEEVAFELNKDYIPATMDAAMLREWVATWQSGGFSYETFIGGLQRGELIPDTITPEDEKERIEQDGPNLALTGDVNANSE